MINLIHGDCLEEMKLIPENTIDAIVTDPPYGLSFMGKKWDYKVPGVEVWQECLRILKPGGYLLSFAGTRTQHRMAVNIEDAGFEIRDMIAWVYGSGFPKSLNIGKAIDKLQGNERIIDTHYVAPDGKWRDCNNHKPNEEIRNPETSYGYKTSGFRPLDRGESEWEGWGTALKPAMEPITVARKPLSEKTVVENVLKWGTGGINIDDSRVETEDNLDRGAYSENKQTNGEWGTMHNFVGKEFEQPQGRFPANFIHDGSDEVTDQFPDKAGAFSPVKAGQKGFGGEIYGKYAQAGDDGATFHGDGLGSAARFFYCAKASKSERGKNNNHPTVKPISLMEYLVKLVSCEGALILDPFAGSGTTGMACVNTNRNFTGIELDDKYFEIAKKRIEQHAQQLRIY